MATDSKMETSFLEKLGDKFTSFADGFVKVLTRVLGSSNERHIRSMGYVRTRDPEKPYRIQAGSLVGRINDLESKMQALSDADLKGLATQFRERLKNGETLEDLLVE